MACINDENKRSIEEAYSRIKDFVRKTPLEFSPFISERGNAKVFLKLESEQLTGSFKLRGAYNKILYSESHKNKVLEYATASSGNHGIACSLVLRDLGLKSRVFSSNQISSAKEKVLNLYGAEVVKHGNDCVDAEMEARKRAKENGWVYISPYADLQIVHGQGTIGVELLDQLPSLDVVFVTVGGGGLASGIGIYLKSMKPDVKIIGCSPINSNVMEQSVKAGRILDIESEDTLSEGSAGGVEAGAITFEFCKDVIDEWVSVTEDEIAQAILYMIDNHHKIIEGAAGVALASYFKTRIEHENKNIAIIICGANIGTEKIKMILNGYST